VPEKLALGFYLITPPDTNVQADISNAHFEIKREKSPL
jgi:hypothetical protein